MMVSMRLLALLGLVSTAVSFLVPAPRLPSAAGVSVRAPLAVATPVAGRQGRTTSLKASGRDSMRMAMERTYIMIKPDGVQRGLVSDIIGRFERRGYHLVALKLTQPTRAMLEEHYSALKEKPFFPKLMDYMTSGPVVAMVWEGKDVVATGRKMLGATNPLESAPGTIRGDFCIEVGRNICHGSDSVDSANREIGLWFSEEELLSWTSHSQDWIYE